MSPSARAIHLDFVRLTAEEPSTLYFERFLRDGAAYWNGLSHRYPALAAWSGVASIKRRLVQLAGFPTQCRVFLSSRSAELMRLAARLMFRRCNNVLTTDLSWPTYQSLVEAEAARTGKRITCVAVRQKLLRKRVSGNELGDLVASASSQSGCDGMFLPAIDNLGVRLPVDAIVAGVRRAGEIRFIVIDGAQAFCHAPDGVSMDDCDFYIAGCHKWLRGYHPMGVAFCGHRALRSFVHSRVKQWLHAGHLGDPLLQLTEQIEYGRMNGYSETVNITPLFSCQGALADAVTSTELKHARFEQQLRNRLILADLADGTSWHALEPSPELRSGILLLEAKHGTALDASPDALRAEFERYGLAVTAYAQGIIRISVPVDRLAASEIDRIRWSLTHI